MCGGDTVTRDELVALHADAEQAALAALRATQARNEAVRVLHDGGVTLRQIADALGLSVQRVSQIARPPAPKPAKRRREVAF